MRRRHRRPPRPPAHADPAPVLGARPATALRGWVVTRKSPLKAAHLERTPYVSCTYWDATHDVAIADCHAAWEEDRDEHARVWELYAARARAARLRLPPDLARRARAPGAALLRLDPWRLHVADAMTVATPRVWRADTAYR